AHATPRSPHSFPTRRSSDLVATAKECDTIIRDDTGGEMLTLPPTLVGSMQDGEFQRFNSSGVVNTALAKYVLGLGPDPQITPRTDRKSTRLNSSHVKISYAV